MRYIRQVHVAYPGTHNQHVARVQHSSTTTGSLAESTREQVVADIDRGQTYRTHHGRTGDEARVETRRSDRGTSYITTVADGRITNNLLSLPRF